MSILFSYLFFPFILRANGSFSFQATRISPGIPMGPHAAPARAISPATGFRSVFGPGRLTGPSAGTGYRVRIINYAVGVWARNIPFPGPGRAYLEISRRRYGPRVKLPFARVQKRRCFRFCLRPRGPTGSRVHGRAQLIFFGAHATFYTIARRGLHPIPPPRSSCPPGNGARSGKRYFVSGKHGV